MAQKTGKQARGGKASCEPFFVEFIPLTCCGSGRRPLPLSKKPQHKTKTTIDAGVVPIWEVEVSGIDDIGDVNTKGMLYGNKVAMTGMIKQGSGYIYNFVCLCLPAVFSPIPFPERKTPT